MEATIRSVGSKIGLIGGLAPAAGIFYYEQLIRRYAELDEVLELDLAHADVAKTVALVMAYDTQAVQQYLGRIAANLFAGGAGLVAVTSVASHLEIEGLAATASGPVVSILETIRNSVSSQHLGRVALFGNRRVLETNAYGAVDADRCLQLEPRLVTRIHEIYMSIALDGKRRPEPEARELEAIATGLIEEQGADAIILAGTDLSSFYASGPPAYKALDAARLHIDDIIRVAHLNPGIGV